MAGRTLAPTPTLPAISLLVAVVRGGGVFDGFAALHVVIFFLGSGLDDGVEIFLQCRDASLQLVVLLQHAALLNAGQNHVARSLFRQQLFDKFVNVG